MSAYHRFKTFHQPGLGRTEEGDCPPIFFFFFFFKRTHKTTERFSEVQKRMLRRHNQTAGFILTPKVHKKEHTAHLINSDKATR